MKHLQIITFLTILVRSTSHEEDKICVADLEHTNESVLKSIKTIELGDLTPSSIIVIDDFLPLDFTIATFENITQQEWTTVMPHHRKDYEKWKSQQTSKDDKALERLVRTPKEDRGVFPGLRTGLTEAYEKALKSKLNELDLEGMMGIEKPLQRSWSSNDSFFGNVCYHPESLGTAQRAPHVDEGFVGKKMVKLAIVHYINPTFQGGGGTSFYRETSSGASRFLYRDCKILQKQIDELRLEPGTTKYIQATSCLCKGSKMGCSMYQWFDQRVQDSRYTSSSTPHYELLLHVPYKFNSAVIYDTKQLHSAFIDDETLQSLNCDAKQGRLTSNIFIV